MKLTTASDAEILARMNAMSDLLKWFRDHGVKIRISPTRKGWSLKYIVTEKVPTPALP